MAYEGVGNGGGRVISTNSRPGTVGHTVTLAPKKPVTTTPSPSAPNPAWNGTATQRQFTPTAAAGGGGGGGGGGGIVGGGGGGGAAPVEAPAPAISDADFLNSDPNVIAQRAAYSKAFEQLIAELDLGQGQYEADYGTSLKNLGWRDGGNGGQGDFDREDTTTSSGRGFQGLQNDYASRGMLQGSGYAEALEGFLKGLGQQKEQLGTARGNFLADNKLKRTQGQQTRDEQIRLAEAGALSNRAGLLTSIQGLV